MDTILGKRNIALAILSIAILIFGYIAYHTNQQSNADITRVHASWVTDLNNDQKLVGLCDNVFLGKVDSEISNKARRKMPETQYRVEVIDNIKGSLDGTVIVNQEGGEINDMGEKRIVLYENDKLLEPGKVYLFATRLNHKENWYTLVPYFGDIPIEDKREINGIKDSLTKMDDGSDIVLIKDRFSKAYQQEIPFDPKAD